MTLRGVEDGIGGDECHFSNTTCNGDDDDKKIFLSRISQSFNEESVLRIFQQKFGENSVEGVYLLYERDEDKNREIDRENIDDANESDEVKVEEEKPHLSHRGFGFVTFDSKKTRDIALSTRTVRGSAKPTSKRKHTMYILPVVRDGSNEGGLSNHGSSRQNQAVEKKNACHLWSMRRCPYGDKCKFLHEGDGACISRNDNNSETKEKKNRQKCFSFKKKGKCKLGDKCPFSHDFQPKTKVANEQNKDEGDGSKKILGEKDDASSCDNDKSKRDCINWKAKGKCRRKDRGCPYRHGKDVQRAALSKIESKKKKRTRNDEGKDEDESNKKNKGKDKKRQPLSVRVFGLNYDTTEEDVRSYFEHCGPIVELTFPTFDDSGRSKGYCGILFQSPKAVEQAVLLDGQELHGRWLSVQQGKMYLRQWEEHHHTSFGKGENENPASTPLAGEFGQKVKRRKRHGFKE